MKFIFGQKLRAPLLAFILFGSIAISTTARAQMVPADRGIRSLRPAEMVHHLLEAVTRPTRTRLEPSASFFLRLIISA